MLRHLCRALTLYLLGSVNIAHAAAVTNQLFLTNICHVLANQGISAPFCLIPPTPVNIKNLTPDKVFSMGYQSTRTTGSTANNQSYNALGEQNAITNNTVKDAEFSRLSFWTKTDNDFGALETTQNSTGYKFDNHNFVLGADYRLKDDWVAGGSFSYQFNNATFDSNHGATSSYTYTGSLYSSYNLTDDLHFETSASYGGLNYQSSRNIVLTGLAPSVASGAPNGEQYTFSLGGGYDFSYRAMILAPYIRGDFLQLNIEQYSETGSIAAMKFARQNVESMISSLGVQTSYTLSMPWGVLTPQLRGEWHHQFLDGQRQIKSSFASDPTGQVLTISGNAPSSDYYSFAAEVSSLFAGGLSAFLAYETLQGYSNISSNKFTLGGRMEF